LAVGLCTTGNSVGGIIYPVVVRQLLPTLGFAWTARVLGFINLACLGLAIVFMRPRLPPRMSGPVIDYTAFREPVFMLFVSGLFCIIWGIFYTFYYVSLFVVRRHMAQRSRECLAYDVNYPWLPKIASFGTQTLDLPYSSASIMVIIINGVGVPARLIPPLFADRYGPLNTITPIAAGGAVVAWSWLAVKNVTGYYVFTTFYGIANGAFQCLLPTTVTSITKRLDMVGTRLGMAFTIASFASLTGPPLGGALQARNGGSFVAPQIWAATSTLLAFILVGLARVYRGGWTFKTRC
jgi:hypothetical protein